eukprot:358818-Pyramimonas_sp.AAC.1
MAPNLDRSPRGDNQGADDLSNMKTTGFDESLRMHMAAAGPRWHVLDEIAQAPLYVSRLHRRGNGG